MLDDVTLFPANIYLCKVNNRNTRKRCEILSMTSLTLNLTPFSSVSIVDYKVVNVSWAVCMVNFGHIQQINLIFLLLTQGIYLLTGRQQIFDSFEQF